MCSWKTAFSRFYILIITYSHILVYSEVVFFWEERKCLTKEDSVAEERESLSLGSDRAG